MKQVKWVLAATAIAVGSIGIGAAPAGAGDMGSLTVTKTVEGDAPADAEFVIDVYCELVLPQDAEIGGALPSGPVNVTIDEQVTFGPEGGEETFPFSSNANGSECTITEVEDGGADEVINREVELTLENTTLYEAEITNVFAEELTTTTTTTAAPTTAAAAAAAVAAPRFTG